jgi:two-component system, cell cycle sensor histidine kinase and response regulator CckA
VSSFLGARHTTKEAGKGTGLGLSTVRGIVEAHNGFINLATAVGSGTTFQVFLPATPRSAPLGNTTASNAAAEAGQGQLVLVVDDEIHIRDMTAAILTRHGYRVLLAGDGIEAVALLAAHNKDIDLVVTDLRMPNLDGAALAHIARRLCPEVKVLAVSGLSSGMDANEMKDIASAFLYKPFKADALLREVSGLLGERA